jgi:hypothetical protein
MGSERLTSLGDPSIEILNRLGSNNSKAEALQNEIEHILNGLPRSSPADASAESTPGRESQPRLRARQRIAGHKAGMETPFIGPVAEAVGC